MVSFMRSRLSCANVLATNTLFVAVLLGGPPAFAQAITPYGGAYDHNGTRGALEFTVNGTGTRIVSGAKIKGGFPCAPKSLFTSERIVIVDGGFSYKGSVVRKSGRPGGTLRWSGMWSSRYDVDGTLRLRKGDCRSGARPFASMAVLPTSVGLTSTSTPGSGQITLDWPKQQAATSYNVLRSADPS